MSRLRNSKTLLILFLALILSAGACTPPPAEPVPPTPEATPTVQEVETGIPWELVWQDEFDGESLNPDNWIMETGAGGWGNHEWQYYTDRPENVRLEDGLLIIEARKEDYRGSDYTSARINTQYLQTWKYGRFEARMKLPTGQGIWAAFWMLGEDLWTAVWPNNGEIDILENIGNPFTIYGSLHGPGYSGGNNVGGAAVSDSALNENFRTYAVEWAPGEIRWFLDDRNYNTITENQVPGRWVFDHPFFLILNVAVGGDWPGSPDETTVFPQRLLVDYVRVYRDPTLSVSDLQGQMLHVSDITMDLQAAGEKWEGTAYVTVVDQDGNPVEGVTVTAGWLGVVTGATKNSVSSEDGIAGPFVGTKTSFSDEISFCISTLDKSPYSYEKSANAQTCAFASP